MKMYGDVQAKLQALGTSALSVQIDAPFALPPGSAQCIGEMVDTTTMDIGKSTLSPPGIYPRLLTYPARNLVTTLTELTSSSIEVSHGPGSVAVEALVSSQYIPRGICGGQSGTKVALGQIFLRVFRLSSASTIAAMPHTHTSPTDAI
jgi:hypothetical protein